MRGLVLEEDAGEGGEADPGESWALTTSADDSVSWTEERRAPGVPVLMT